jgi:hypothetical protein
MYFGLYGAKKCDVKEQRDLRTMDSYLDIGSLFQTQRTREDGKMRVYEAILERIHNRIKAASRTAGGTVCHVWYQVPEFLVGLPR